MYFVDREKINETLLFMEKLLKTFEKHETLSSNYEKLSLERLIHLLIESTLDVGNMMIDGFIMRDPGSYEDIIDILVDEKVLPQEDKENYKEMVQLREMIVQNYLHIDHELLYDRLVRNEQVMKDFGHHVRSYLNTELGVAHAFSNNKEG